MQSICYLECAACLEAQGWLKKTGAAYAFRDIKSGNFSMIDGFVPAALFRFSQLGQRSRIMLSLLTTVA